jgi:hypothetical protein
MTCIVGIVHDGKVTIGGDSAGATGSIILQRADSKVFTVGPYVFGFTTSFRMGQLLRYSIDIPTPDSWDVDRFMSTKFIDHVRKCLKDGGWARTTQGDGYVSGSEAGGTFLVGINGRLYNIGDDYQVGVSADGYDACGAGTLAALGALYATKGMGPGDRVDIALRAAEYLNPYVRAPFVTVTK